MLKEQQNPPKTKQEKRSFQRWIKVSSCHSFFGCKVMVTDEKTVSKQQSTRMPKWGQTVLGHAWLIGRKCGMFHIQDRN